MNSTKPNKPTTIQLNLRSLCLWFPAHRAGAGHRRPLYKGQIALRQHLASTKAHLDFDFSTLYNKDIQSKSAERKGVSVYEVDLGINIDEWEQMAPTRTQSQTPGDINERAYAATNQYPSGAGLGFGVRDMQYLTQTQQEAQALQEQLRKAFAHTIEYIAIGEYNDEP